MASSNQRLLMEKQAEPFSLIKPFQSLWETNSKGRESEKCQMLEQFCFISELCKQMIAPLFSSSSCFPSPSPVCVPGRVKMKHLQYLLQRSGRRSEEALRKEIRRWLEQVGGVWCACWDTGLEYIMPRQELQQLFSVINSIKSCSL